MKVGLPCTLQPHVGKCLTKEYLNKLSIINYINVIGVNVNVNSNSDVCVVNAAAAF